MGHQPSPCAANSAVNAELAQENQQEYYAQQQAWSQEHAMIQSQGGLNWSSQNPNAVPNAVPSSTPAPTPTPNAPKANISGDQTMNMAKAT